MSGTPTHRRRYRDAALGTPTTMTLQSMGTDQLEEARISTSGRASRTLHSGARLRQTLIALIAGTRMNEHQSPGDATVHCLRGHVTLHTRERTVTVAEGVLADVPPERHDLVADQDSVLILTVAVV
ncbi:cupin domain-containing protein [Jiangella mangrovi]|uniref:Quercetin dioxygenase-like cupin family protein n=1 Tax=Jiangella mangrovi TaxID=1524084 RepID=A0A7W9GVH3_9ACTN|nr:cupin domain-containing protein [Jiangella mangrovi]MBB5790493.1 quercetin dioxygenase-like cupin family protein [Jiangella mangrovi]